MSTRAIQILEQKKIPFEVVKYNHEEKGAKFASKASGFPLERTVKTLVVDLGEKQYTLVLMPGDKQLSMKRLARIRVLNVRLWRIPGQPSALPVIWWEASALLEPARSCKWSWKKVY